MRDEAERQRHRAGVAEHSGGICATDRYSRWVNSKNGAMSGAFSGAYGSISRAQTRCSTDPCCHRRESNRIARSDRQGKIDELIAQNLSGDHEKMKAERRNGIAGSCRNSSRIAQLTETHASGTQKARDATRSRARTARSSRGPMRCRPHSCADPRGQPQFSIRSPGNIDELIAQT